MGRAKPVQGLIFLYLNPILSGDYSARGPNLLDHRHRLNIFHATGMAHRADPSDAVAFDCQLRRAIGTGRAASVLSSGLVASDTASDRQQPSS